MCLAWNQEMSKRRSTWLTVASIYFEMLAETSKESSIEVAFK